MGCGPSTPGSAAYEAAKASAEVQDKRARSKGITWNAENREKLMQNQEAARMARAAEHTAQQKAEQAEYKKAQQAAEGGGGKEPSAAELNIMLALLETVIIKDGKVNQAAESDIMQQVESPLNRQNMINIAKGKSNKAATAVKILRILFAINSAKNCFTAAEKREVKTIFQREGGVTRRVKRR